jgi:hypothetical protein
MRAPVHRALAASLWCCAVVLASGLANQSRAEGNADPATDSGAALEVLDMSPEVPPTWSFRYLAAPVISLFRGPAYMYKERRVRIDTTPAGGWVDLFYVRSGFQKRFEQAEAPVVVILPSRLQAGPRDTFKIRAFAEGYQQKSVVYRVSEDFDEVNLDLSPLPNLLDGLSHRYFAGRSSISFLTREALTFRLQEAEDGFAVILTQTAMSEEARHAVETLRSPLIEESYGQQLGEDLMVKVVMKPRARGGAVELRSRQSYIVPRDLHVFTIDVVPADSAAEAVADALAALASLSPSDVSGCTLAFDDSLRASLDDGELARALRPQGEFTDRYLRAAMRRLGEISVDGVVDFTDGMQLRPQTTIELEMAINNASHARGYLALLRSFVGRLEGESGDPREALRSLLAPEMPADRFDGQLESAESAEARCAGSH